MMNIDTSSDNAELSWAAAYIDAGIVASLPAPAHASVAEFVHERCKYFVARPEKHPAFTCVMPNGMNGRLSFAAVDAHSDAFAGYLRGVLGLNAGDRVACTTTQQPGLSGCCIWCDKGWLCAGQYQPSVYAHRDDSSIQRCRCTRAGSGRSICR